MIEMNTNNEKKNTKIHNYNPFFKRIIESINS